MSLLVFFWVFTIFTGQVYAGTFYLYMEETCNGERGLFLTGAREGILDTFFERDQIIFDDMADSGKGGFIASRDVAGPLAAARRGGADYLLAVDIKTIVEKTDASPKARENIKSVCTFLLFEVGTGWLLEEGTLQMEKKGLEEKKERDELGFALGIEISAALGKYFSL
jgi:hypothetical protein